MRCKGNLKELLFSYFLFRFYSCCPICFDEERFYWVNAYDNGDDYIWDDCDLECDKCKNRSFILHHSFKCGKNNHNEYEQADAYALIDAISALANIPGLNGPTRVKMRKILTKYAK